MVQKVFQIVFLRPKCCKKHLIFFHDFHFQTKSYNFYLYVAGKNVINYSILVARLFL